MKLQEMFEKTIDELKETALSLKKELFSLRMKHNKMNQLENPSLIRQTKRKIAQVKTVIKQKELQNAQKS